MSEEVQKQLVKSCELEIIELPLTKPAAARAFESTTDALRNSVQKQQQLSTQVYSLQDLLACTCSAYLHDP